LSIDVSLDIVKYNIEIYRNRWIGYVYLYK